MSKVKLTREQAEEIKKIEDVDYAINILSLNKRPDNPLAELTIAEIARALYVGYELEPELKVGEWVITPYGTVGKLLVIPFSKPYSKKFKFYVDSLGYRKPERLIPLSELERATPEEIEEEKERRWWAKHGRKPWELKIFDILHDGQHPYVITGIDHEYSRIELDGSGNLDLDGIEKR